jgi:cysteinyl-tRNA synthetase
LANALIKVEDADSRIPPSGDKFRDLLDQLLKIGKGVSKGTFAAINDLFSKLGGDVLGIVKDRGKDVTVPVESLGLNLSLKEPNISGNNIDIDVDAIIEIIINVRNEARKKKDFAKADELRNKLDKAGIVLEDKPDGTIWRTK